MSHLLGLRLTFVDVYRFKLGWVSWTLVGSSSADRQEIYRSQSHRQLQLTLPSIPVEMRSWA
jgi:hypothetical protein